MAEDRLIVDGVTKSFSRGRRVPELAVLGGVSFTVAAGEFVSVIGPSGCGKSTVFNMLAGLETPSAGTVEFRASGSADPAAHCAYMPQRDLLFPWRSILDNTILGLQVQGVARQEARRRARALFPVFGLAGFEDARPAHLSGGMRQRAALLRTVVQDRELLLLDEPFGALDSLTRTEMQSWLREVWQRYRWTVLMITHDIREAVFLSDRVLVLSARPAVVRHELRVDLPRPRDLSTITTPEFAAMEQELLEILHEESRRALAEQRDTKH
ncbi:ABC transporter ATP-binding protein [Nocardia rhizosphaerae]|uniref:ABC transporter ATP-binding protein n=1 Tax=Nocardia rhizosphaerae TaxID=1691571 RepID=A0ABV8L5N9_9NOCA